MVDLKLVGNHGSQLEQVLLLPKHLRVEDTLQVGVKCLHECKKHLRLRHEVGLEGSELKRGHLVFFGDYDLRRSGQTDSHDWNKAGEYSNFCLVDSKYDSEIDRVAWD